MSADQPELTRLTGVQFSPNTEAEDLQRYAGIKFQNIPDKVSLNPYNRLMLLVQFIRPGLAKEALAVNLQLFKPNTIGLYVPGFHAYVTRSSDPFIGRHENTHAYIDEINPEVREQAEAINSRIKYILMGQDSQDLDVEQAAVYNCFNEGFSQWMAIFVGLQTADSSQVKIATKYHNKMMANHENRKKLTKNTTYAQSRLGEIRKVVKSIQAELETSRKLVAVSGGLNNQTKGRIGREGARAYFKTVFPGKLNMDDASYRAGYYFSSLFMEGAQQRRLTVAEASSLVISNPPSMIDELGEPQRYLRQLLKVA